MSVPTDVLWRAKRRYEPDAPRASWIVGRPRGAWREVGGGFTPDVLPRCSDCGAETGEHCFVVVVRYAEPCAQTAFHGCLSQFPSVHSVPVASLPARGCRCSTERWAAARLGDRRMSTCPVYDIRGAGLAPLAPKRDMSPSIPCPPPQTSLFPLYMGEQCVAHVSSAKLILHLEGLAPAERDEARAKARLFFAAMRQPVVSWGRKFDDFTNLVEALVQPKLDLALIDREDIVVVYLMMSAAWWGARLGPQRLGALAASASEAEAP